jgi:hypothetical protein
MFATGLHECLTAQKLSQKTRKRDGVFFVNYPLEQGTFTPLWCWIYKIGNRTYSAHFFLVTGKDHWRTIADSIFNGKGEMPFSLRYEVLAFNFQYLLCGNKS